MSKSEEFVRWRPHPWHGLTAGERAPEVVRAYIEMTPFDTVKYETDKKSGYLQVDRPQRTSATPPLLYGFIPRTYCDSRVGGLMESLRGVKAVGDNDPLDICVVSERPINRADVILNARVLGGLPMLDGGEADDKIIAVLEDDLIWSDAQDIDDLPEILIERLIHYFTTYKIQPGKESSVSISGAYNKAHAIKVIEAAMADYQAKFPDIEV